MLASHSLAVLSTTEALNASDTPSGRSAICQCQAVGDHLQLICPLSMLNWQWSPSVREITLIGGSAKPRQCVCDGRGATAHELHTSAPCLRPLAHPTDMVCTHTHTQTLIPLITIGSSLSETANCPDWQGGLLKWSGPDHLDKVAFNKPLRHYLCIT